MKILPAKRMASQWEFCQWVIVALQSDRLGVAYFVDDIDGVACVFDAEAVASKDMTIALGVELGETSAELKLLAVDVQSAVGAFLALNSVLREILGIDAEEVSHASLLQLKEASNAVVRGDVNDILFHWTEHPLEHIVEVNADVGCHAAAFVDIAFPRGVVPVAARGDIGEVNVVDLIFRAVLNLLLQIDDGLVQTKLKDCVDAMTSLLLDVEQSIYVPWVQNEWFLADDIGTETESVAHVCVVEIVRRADRDIVDIVACLFQFGAMAVKEFLFCKEGGFWEEAVHDANAVKAVVGSKEVVACVFDGAEVTWSDIATDTDESEIFHYILFVFLVFDFCYFVVLE